MKYIYLICTLNLTLIFSSNFKSQTLDKNIANDFSTLSGNWLGSLTYLDYSTGKPFTMQANLEVKKIGESRKFIFLNQYPKESNANSSDTITISNDEKTP